MILRTTDWYSKVKIVKFGFFIVENSQNFDVLFPNFPVIVGKIEIFLVLMSKLWL